MAPAPNYIQEMTATDSEKQAHSFLATEENYQFIRQMQIKNMFIPVVGDFAGPKAIRKVADYVKQHNSVVSAFYISNVETYLSSAARGGTPEKLQNFYQNAAALPVDRSSLFIRFVGAQNAGNLRWWKGDWLQVVSPMVDLRDKINSGARPSYNEALQMIPDPKTLAP